MALSEQIHQSKINRISLIILRISIKKNQHSTVPFQEGDEVEVVSKENGFRGSYYTATILSSIGASHYESDTRTLLRSLDVRPVPPDQNEAVIAHGGFSVYNMVDVFANDGWWFGVIDRIIGEDYYVYFPTTDDNIAYPVDVLRCHHEWVNDHWTLM
ncbi:unnamed protein product [Withania somnifera]